MCRSVKKGGSEVKVFLLGLGLIGGSLAKALKAAGGYEIWAYDQDAETLTLALDEGAIDHRGTFADMAKVDLILLALPFRASLEFLTTQAKDLPTGPMIIDTCGVKSEICQAMVELMDQGGPLCLGAHPMAGRELYGYDHSLANLFFGASLIVCPLETMEASRVASLRKVAQDLGFAHIEVSDPDTHDRIIAYTSQLAHIISSAYIKSPTMTEEDGYSAGSFRDMTRVARLEAGQWADLMMANREHLSHEIEMMIAHLKDFQAHLDRRDLAGLLEELEEGNQRKLWSSAHSKAF